MACAPPHSPIQQRVQSQRFDFVQLFLLHGRNGGVLAARYVQFQGKVGSSRSQVEGRYEHIRHDAGVRADTRDVRLVVQPKCAQSRDAGTTRRATTSRACQLGCVRTSGARPFRCSPESFPSIARLAPLGCATGLTSRVGMRAPDRVGSASYLPYLSPTCLLLGTYLAAIPPPFRPCNKKS